MATAFGIDRRSSTSTPRCTSRSSTKGSNAAGRNSYATSSGGSQVSLADQAREVETLEEESTTIAGSGKRVILTDTVEI
jgi:hypothetical protein